MDEALREDYRRLRTHPPIATALFYLAVLTRPLTRVDTLQVASRLKLAKDDAAMLEQTVRLRELEPGLSVKEMSPSELVHQLSDFQDTALELAARVTLPIITERIHLFRAQLRHVKPHLDGGDLKRLGVPAGPHYGEILELLRDQRLDGKMRTRQDEEAWVRNWLVEKG
jgi:tRNA nucleotidyltransferase (CCA-adding enzyme)